MTRALYAAVPLLAGPAVMARWFLGGLESGSPSAESPIRHLWSARPHLAEYARLLHHWFLNGYTNRVDDALAILLVLALALLLARGPKSAEDTPTTLATRRLPLLLSGCLAAGYLVFPFEILTPFHWWAMNVRLLPLLFVWLVVSAAPSPIDAPARALLAVVAAASAAFFVFVAHDIRYVFNGAAEAGGLGPVLRVLPKGARVLGLYTDYRQRPRYAYYPFAYAAMYAVVERGGLAAPFVRVPQSWTNPIRIPEFPVAGDAAFFQLARHAAPYTHFLVRTCEGSGCVPDPLSSAVETRLVAATGRFRLYECASSRCFRPASPLP